MLNPPPPQPSLPPIAYVEQAPVGFDYSATQVGEYSRLGNYLIENPPFPIEATSRLLYIDASCYLIDSGGNQRFDELSDTQKIAKEFVALTREWKSANRMVSSLSDMFMHPAYQRIMAMGPAALPLILKDLRQNSGHWFHALEYIAGKDMAAGATTMTEAVDAWLKWGEEEGVI